MTRTGISQAKLTSVKSSQGGKRKKARKESYTSYIYKVLKQVHPTTGISKRGMSILDSFVNDIFERLASEAGKLSRYSKRSTLTSRDIQSACRLVLPGELSRHSVSEGSKAIIMFTEANKKN